jgi:hypothetical protein
VMSWRAKNRDSALRLAEIRRLRRIETSSSNVRSLCSPIRARIRCEYFSRRSLHGASVHTSHLRESVAASGSRNSR